MEELGIVKAIWLLKIDSFFCFISDYLKFILFLFPFCSHFPPSTYPFSPTLASSFLHLQYPCIFFLLSCSQLFQLFFFCIFFGFLCILYTSAAPQRQAYGTLLSQVATCLRTDRVCRILGRCQIRTRDN